MAERRTPNAERTNLIAVVTTAGGDHPHVAVRVSAPLCEYLSWRRFLSDQLTVATMARDIARAIGDLRNEADFWNNLGSALQDLHRFNEAIAVLQRARDLYQQIDDCHSEADAWNNLGLTPRSVHHYDEAITVHERARDLYQQIGDLHREAGAWSNLGLTLREVQQMFEAMHAFQRAAVLYAEAQDDDRRQVLRLLSSARDAHERLRREALARIIGSHS
ncbi:tetratricopeptide repeat protein [Marinitenerispora sediminis]|uniref:tetratricopeptide repeat protein n=2 Tax=Marinitenerispora sediminis TaxID=1931232 RepID=UPI0011C06227|nr:tetratricopeptide repeat protein [Marinitenerispora sediminis]